MWCLKKIQTHKIDEIIKDLKFLRELLQIKSIECKKNKIRKKILQWRILRMNLCKFVESRKCGIPSSD